VAFSPNVARFFLGSLEALAKVFHLSSTSTLSYPRGQHPHQALEASKPASSTARTRRLSHFGARSSVSSHSGIPLIIKVSVLSFWLLNRYTHGHHLTVHLSEPALLNSTLVVLTCPFFYRTSQEPPSLDRWLTAGKWRGAGV
jgi:hypothetical protein